MHIVTVTRYHGRGQFCELLMQAVDQNQKCHIQYPVKINVGSGIIDG